MKVVITGHRTTNQYVWGGVTYMLWMQLFYAIIGVTNNES